MSTSTIQDPATATQVASSSKASAKEPGSDEAKLHGAAADDLSEVEYIEREQRRAASEIEAALARVKAQLKDAADVRLWADACPWTTVAVAAVAGFTAATAIIPQKAAPAAKRQGAFEDGGADSHAAAQMKSSVPPLIGTIVASLFDLARVALERSFAAKQP